MSRRAPLAAPRPKRRARRAGPRAMLLVALCFAGSAALRVTDGDGAIAKEIATATATAPDPAAPALSRPLPACAPDPGTDALLEAIRARETQLEARAAELAETEQVIRVARAKLDEQIAALGDAERRLAETLALADKAAEADLARLVAVYEAMNPKAAAQIFASMDVGFAAGFLARMKAEIAGAILAGLPAERAYAISATMAGRNARAPTE